MADPEPRPFNFFEWLLSSFRPFEVISGAATMIWVISWFLQAPAPLLYIFGTTAFLCGSIGIVGQIKSAAERPTLQLGRLWSEGNGSTQRTRLTDSPIQVLPEAKDQEKPAPLEPNIVCEARTMIDAHWIHGDFVGEGEKAYRDRHLGKDNFKAVIATYRNKILKDRQIGARQNVTAQITYSFYDPLGSVSANRAVWLSPDEIKVDFYVNDSHSLIVAIWERGRLYALQENRHGGYNVRTKTLDLASELARVHIEIFSEWESRAIAETDLMLEVVRNPKFDIKLERPLIWKSRKLTEFIQAGRQLVDGEQEDESELEQRFEEWEAEVARFVFTHLGDTFRKQFRPPPYEPPLSTPRWAKHLVEALKPVGVHNKIRSKIEILERFQNEV